MLRHQVSYKHIQLLELMMKIKENLQEVSGQPYVVENGYLFVL